MQKNETEWPYLSTENSSQKNLFEDDVWKNTTPSSEPKKEIVPHIKSRKQKYVRRFQKRK